MPSPESSTQRIVVTPTTSAVKAIELADSHISVNPAAGQQVSVVNAGPVGPYGNGLYVVDQPWMDAVDETLDQLSSVPIQFVVSRKTDGNTNISATNTTSPTYVTGTYIGVNTPVSYDRLVLLNGTITSSITEGGTVVNRAVHYFPAMRTNEQNGSPGAVYINDLYPFASQLATGANAIIPDAQVRFDRIDFLPANTTREYRIYGYRAASTVHVASARSTNTQLTALILPTSVARFVM